MSRVEGPHLIKVHANKLMKEGCPEKKNVQCMAHTCFTHAAYVSKLPRHKRFFSASPNQQFYQGLSELAN